MTVTITTDQWLAELERVQQETPVGYLTASQMVERAGRGKKWIWRRLGELKREGRLVFRYVQETDAINKTRWTPAYLILPRKSGDKRIIAGVGARGDLDALRDGCGRTGGPFYGFDIDSDGISQENPDERAVILRMTEWRGQGWSYMRIAKRLEAAGIPAKRGSRWHPSVIRRILMRFSAEQAMRKAGRDKLTFQNGTSRKAKEAKL